MALEAFASELFIYKFFK